MRLHIPILYVVIAALLIVVLLQRCSSKKTVCPDVTRIDSVFTRDTVYMPFSGTVVTIPAWTDTRPAPLLVIPPSYVAKATYDSLLDQYQSVLTELFAVNTFRDTIRKDSCALYVTSTVQQNRLLSNQFDYDLRFPLIRERVSIASTIAEKPRRQVYIGGHLAGNNKQVIDRIGVALLYKDRKDRMFGGGADLNSLGTVNYSINSFWKISFK